MKLVEILARGIVEWKEGWFTIDQSNVDGEIYAYNEEDVLSATGIFLDKAEDPDNYVYREQWQAERDRIMGMEKEFQMTGEDTIQIAKSLHEQDALVYEPTYEQQLWDRVAAQAIPALLATSQEWTSDEEASAPMESWADIAKGCAQLADAFMAERAKRLNKGE